MAAASSALSDKPIAVFRSQLLDIAFETATSIPIKPHIKDRSRAQEKVVGVTLKLDQPQKALQFIEKIDDWRRGAGYGDLAFYHVINGQKDVARYIELAKGIADISEDWRRDTIKVKIAKIYTLLGEEEQAKTFEQNITDSETGKVAAVKAKMADEESFEDQFKAIEDIIKTENFDMIKNGLESYTELFNRFYGNKKLRERVEDKIKSSWEKMPMVIRIDLLSRLVEITLDHEDKSKAGKLIREAEKIISDHEWPLENLIPITANLTKLKYKTGDAKKAIKDAGDLLDKFGSEKEVIVDIYRAQALLPLAEAFSIMGEAISALDVYKLALEESVINPNSRPRAEDLSAILSSMAQYGAEPDETMWKRIREIKDSLGNPW